MSERRGLGRGLHALIPATEAPDRTLRDLPVTAIEPNRRQPRGIFDEEELNELAASIREVGLLQPVVVRELGGGRFELVAGERRLRAVRQLGMPTIAAIVRDTGDSDLLREALIENIHRTQLNPLEEAAAYRQLLDDFGVTQEELASRLGRSRPTISNALRLLTLPPDVQRRVAAGVLSGGHAKALLSLASVADQERLATKVVAEGLSVRATEELVRLWNEDGDGPARTPARKSRRRLHAPGLADLEARLSDALQTRVSVRMGARTGRLQIDFASVDDLERIVGVIAHGLERDIPVQEQPL